MKIKIVSLSALLALALVGSAAAQNPVGAAEATPLATQNHYKCYDVPQFGPFAPPSVRLKDQFGATEGQAIRPFLHCNPVDKNGEGIPYPDVHLLCYELVEGPYLGPFALRIDNQFGSLHIRTDRPRVLCVPSYKYHLAADDPIDSDGGK